MGKVDRLALDALHRRALSLLEEVARGSGISQDGQNVAVAHDKIAQCLEVLGRPGEQRAALETGRAILDAALDDLGV